MKVCVETSFEEKFENVQKHCFNLALGVKEKNNEMRFLRCCGIL